MILKIETLSTYRQLTRRTNRAIFFSLQKIKQNWWADLILSHSVILVELFSSNLSAGNDFFFSWFVMLWTLIKYFSLLAFLFGSLSLQSIFLVLSLSTLYTPTWPGYDSGFFVTSIKFSKMAHLRINAQNMFFFWLMLLMNCLTCVKYLLPHPGARELIFCYEIWL